MARFMFLFLSLACAAGFNAYGDSGCFGLTNFYLGPKVYYGKLKADNTDSAIGGLLGLDNADTDPKGWLYGLDAGYSYQRPWGFYAGVNLGYGQGKLKADDALTRYLHEYEATAVFGYQMGGGFCDCWSFTPYIGLGYSVQHYNLTHFHVTYRNNVLHIPVGFIGKYAFYALSGSWSLGLRAAVMPQADSKVKINVLQGAYWTLAKRTDWFVSIPVEYCHSCLPFPLRLDLFYKKIGYGGSKAVNSSGDALGLPPARYSALGCSFDVVLRF